MADGGVIPFPSHHAKVVAFSRSASPRLSWPILALAALFAAAVFLRLFHLGEPSLTHDEAIRANFAMRGDWNEMRRLTPGQVVLHRLIQTAFPMNELALRLPYALAGLFCMAWMAQLAWKEMGPGAAVWCAALAASHSELVNYSRLVKVFSFEAAFSALLMFTGLAAYRQMSRAAMGRYLAAGLLGLTFSFTSSLWIAAWTPIMLWRAWKMRAAGGAERTSALDRGSNTAGGDCSDGPPWAIARRVLGVKGVLAGAGLGWVWWLAGGTYRTALVGYHGEQLALWPATYEPGALAHWLWGSTCSAAYYVVGVGEIWPPLSTALATALGLAFFAGIVPAGRRLPPLFAALGLLSALAIVLGAARVWPFGGIHAVIYWVPPFVLIAGAGLDELAARLGRNPAFMALAVLCVGVPAARAAKFVLLEPARREDIRPLVQYAMGHAEPGDGLFVYYASREAIQFYAPLLTGMDVMVQPGEDRGRPERFLERFEEMSLAHARIWVLITHEWKGEGGQFRSELERRANVTIAASTGDSALWLIEGDLRQPHRDLRTAEPSR